MTKCILYQIFSWFSGVLSHNNFGVLNDSSVVWDVRCSRLPTVCVCVRVNVWLMIFTLYFSCCCPAVNTSRFVFGSGLFLPFFICVLSPPDEIIAPDSIDDCNRIARASENEYSSVRICVLPPPPHHLSLSLSRYHFILTRSSEADREE